MKDAWDTTAELFFAVIVGGAVFGFGVICAMMGYWAWTHTLWFQPFVWTAWVTVCIFIAGCIMSWQVNERKAKVKA